MAIDPLTAKILAKVAIKNITDEETRKRTFIIILAPTIGVLLLISFILYIITSPFSLLAGWLIGDEINAVKDFQNSYGYTQYIGISDESYLESDGQDFSGLTFKDGSTEVVYYNQCDARWKNEPYGKSDKIGSHGCGPTSMAIVISSLTGRKVDPVQMANWSYDTISETKH